MKRTIALALVALGSLACGPAAHTRAAGAVAALAVTPVAWNAAKAPLGKVRAVADDGRVVAVFADDGASVFTAGARVAQDRSVTDWRDAATIAAADGSTPWIVGVSGQGRLYYLRGQTSLQDVTERYGLGSARLLGAAGLGSRYVGFLLNGELAVADGSRVTRYASPGVLGLVGGGGFGAGVVPDGVDLFDVAKGARTRYALPGVTHAAIGAKGRLYATTSRAVYATNDAGELQLVYDAEGDRIHGIVASGERVWFADGAELGLVEGGRVAETSGAKIGAEATLAPSPSGDVWVLSGGALDRYARGQGAPSEPGSWGATLAPIFARSCAGCHMPDGEAGADLSTAGAWEKERGEIRERVVEKRSMPPAGHALSEADRAAIKAWVEDAKGGP
jgi:mono/diheme cytochrome c family protein